MMYKVQRFVRTRPLVSLLIAVVLIFLILAWISSMRKKRLAQAESVDVPANSAAALWLGKAKMTAFAAPLNSQAIIATRNPAALYAAAR